MKQREGDQVETAEQETRSALHSFEGPEQTKEELAEVREKTDRALEKEKDAEVSLSPHLTTTSEKSLRLAFLGGSKP